MSPSSPRQIDLWFAFCAEIADADLLARYRQLLSPEEREQESRFFAARDRHRYLVTRALVRTTLSRYAPLAPERWVFGTNSHGRPHIADPHPDATDLSFNISHTREVVFLGIAHQSILGVDVECIRETSDPLDLADRYFSTAEAQSLRALPRSARVERFFDYWTLKESYIKARGLGLSIPLDSFGFDTRASGTPLDIRPALGDDTREWEFRLFRPSTNHVAAICVELPDRSSVSELAIRKVVPLVGDWPLDCEERGRSR